VHANWKNDSAFLAEQKAQQSKNICQSYLALGGSGCGLSITLEAFELIEVFTAVLGGSGCGLSITFEPGLPNLDTGLLNFDSGREAGCEFFPETRMIDLCPDLVDCAMTISVASRLGLPAFSEDGCWLWTSAKAKFVVRRIAADKTQANERIFI
jgi:hypothetical protein